MSGLRRHCRICRTELPRKRRRRGRCWRCQRILDEGGKEALAAARALACIGRHEDNTAHHHAAKVANFANRYGQVTQGFSHLSDAARYANDAAKKLAEETWDLIEKSAK